MGLHPEFPKSPYAELLPETRWFPAAEELRAKAYGRLLPPLVARILDDKPGRYTVAVKVIDIFGNDTMTRVPVNVG